MSKSRFMAKKMGKKEEAKASKKMPANFKQKLSLVIPCYNEAAQVTRLVKSLERFDRLWDGAYEVILVDDGSKDDTATHLQAALLQAALTKGEAEVLALPKNVGKGGALQAGVARATGDFILTLDADTATPPQQVKEWLAQLPGHTFPPDKILIGSRENDFSQVKGTPLRRFAGLIYNFIVQFFTNLTFSDTQCGFKLYPATIGKPLFANLHNKGWAHDIELLYQAALQGIKIVPMPITWQHQDDSKISLVKDSLQMAWDTLLITSRLTWNWMVIQPLKDLRQPRPATESSLFRFLFVLVSLLLLIGMPWLSSDYGITGDEEVQRIYGEKVLAYFQSDGENREALNYKNLYYYGGLFDYLAAYLHQYLPHWDIYQLRHLLNAFFGFILIYFTGLLGKELGNSWRMGFFALIFMALSPRIFGHAMNNPKDIPFAAAYVFTSLYLVRLIKHLPRPGSKILLCLAVGIAAAINFRVGGLLLIAYLALIVFTFIFVKKEGQPVFKSDLQFFKMGGRFLLVMVLGYLGGLCFWPYGWEAPLRHPWQALQEMSNFSTSIRMLFAGSHLWSDELPWYYTLQWLGMVAPLFILLGLLLALLRLPFLPKKVDRFALVFVAFSFVFPISYAIYKGASLYDGIRHFLFVYPVLAVLAALGWHQLMLMAKSGWPRRLVGLGLAALCGWSLFWMVKNHPHQYVYFNELVGGVAGAHGQYEVDYWMNSAKELSEYLVEKELPGKETEGLVVLSNCFGPVNHYLGQAAPGLKVVYANYYNRHQYSADYYLFLPRFVDRNLLLRGAYPPPEVIKTVSVEGITLGSLSKATDRFDQKGYAAFEAQDYSAAIDWYEKALAANPRNDAALLGMAEAALAAENYPKLLQAAQQLLQLSNTNINGLSALANYHLKTNDLNKAEETFTQMTLLDSKYKEAYYQLFFIYALQNNTQQALEMLEHYDREEGQREDLFRRGIDLANQAGLTHKALYFHAKMTYHQEDYQSSIESLEASLQVNNRYRPALQLMEIYNEVFEQQNR